MLELDIVISENFDETTQEFIEVTKTVVLEHSLLSLSKWESKYERSFTSKGPSTPDEIMDYFRFMCVGPVADDLLANISKKNVDEINNYINSKSTATYFSDDGNKKRGQNDVVTAELIYYWMTALNIPKECETWHLNRLFAFIKVVNLKNSKPKKKTKRETLEENARLNAERMARLQAQKEAK